MLYNLYPKVYQKYHECIYIYINIYIIVGLSEINGNTDYFVKKIRVQYILPIYQTCIRTSLRMNTRMDELTMFMYCMSLS